MGDLRRARTLDARDGLLGVAALRYRGPRRIKLTSGIAAKVKGLLVGDKDKATRTRSRRRKSRRDHAPRRRRPRRQAQELLDRIARDRKAVLRTRRRGADFHYGDHAMNTSMNRRRARHGRDATGQRRSRPSAWSMCACRPWLRPARSTRSHSRGSAFATFDCAFTCSWTRDLDRSSCPGRAMPLARLTDRAYLQFSKGGTK
jgi:hypothetical protein